MWIFLNIAKNLWHKNYNQKNENIKNHFKYALIMSK